jgi:type VI protein secretion system component VasA
VRRQAETGGEERLEHNQLAFRRGDFLCPRDTSNSATKVTQPLHILHADRRHPRHTKIHRIASVQLLRRQSTQRFLRRCVGRRRSGSGRRRGRHRYVPSAAAGGLLHSSQISGEQEQGGQTSSQTVEKAARVFMERGK